MRLTAPEREFLDEALQRRDQAQVAETARVAEQTRLRHRARRRAFALGATVAAIATASIVAIVTAGGTGNAARIAMVSAADSPDPGASYEQGFVRAERDFDLTIDRRKFQESPDALISELAADGIDLVILDPIASTRTAHVIFDPNTHYVLTGYGGGALDTLRNVTSLSWADEQGGFLAGVAAATTTRTGIIGFLGAFNRKGQDDARAGFEAGAKSIDPNVDVLAAYIADFPSDRAPMNLPEGARYVANLLYGAGADVIYHNVGRSGAGVLQAAASDVTTTFRLVIGADTDQWQSASTQERPHVLTSIIKDFDGQSYALIEAYLGDNLESGPRRVTVGDDMITYASNPALSADARANLDRTIQQLISGAIQPPRTPTGEVSDMESFESGTGMGSVVVANVPIKFTVPAGWASWNGGVFKGPMRYWGPGARWEPDSGEPLYGVTFWTVDNLYVDNCKYVLLDPPVGRTVDELAEALANIPGLNATPAIDITVDSFSGKQIEFTIPDYTQDKDCDNKRFTLWGDVGGVLGYWAEGPNEHLLLKILDVDGTRLVITASYLPDASPQDRADLAEILASIRLG